MSNRLPTADRTSHSSTIANGGSWSLEQNLAYTLFIDINKKSMTSKKKMRQMDFYDKLSMFVGTRTSSQCRSHHQKLFAKYKHLTKIRQLFRNQIGIAQYRRKLGQGLQKMAKVERQHKTMPKTPVVERNSEEESSESSESEAKEYPFSSYPINYYPSFPPFHPMHFGYGADTREVATNPYWAGYHAAMRWMMGHGRPQ